MSDFNFIILLLINGLISISLFISALVYFFTQAKYENHTSTGRILLFSGLVCAAGIINALMMRYAVRFPKIGGYDLNSVYNLIINLAAAVLSFFSYILYLRVGQRFSHSVGMPGSTLLEQKENSGRLNWKLILIPIPFLILWTFFWFGFASPEPTELALASTPEGDSPMVYIYTFYTASVLAPITEEILYRHFAMGLFARWFGSSKLALVLNIWLSSLIFAIAHAGVVTADWIKIVQILPVGMVFGWINLKKGLEHSILCHSLFNTFIIPASILLEYAMGL
ncbi:MAG: CPBP family intramembrane glutamic endopeptidase [Caldicoprobacterales bacterium]|nr:CPBP family intramembrane metalloprotease [Clostridiales bacterium]